MKSVDRVDRLLSLLCNDVVFVAATRFCKLLAGTDIHEEVNKELLAEIEDDIEIIRVTIANNADRISRLAANAADDYLTQFGVDSADIDYYKLGYFACNILAADGKLSINQSKICQLMGVYTLDLFVEADKGESIPNEFLEKIIFSIFENSVQTDYGKFGIYTIFKIASKI